MRSSNPEATLTLAFFFAMGALSKENYGGFQAKNKENSISYIYVPVPETTITHTITTTQFTTSTFTKLSTSGASENHSNKMISSLITSKSSASTTAVETGRKKSTLTTNSSMSHSSNIAVPTKMYVGDSLPDELRTPIPQYNGDEPAPEDTDETEKDQNKLLEKPSWSKNTTNTANPPENVKEKWGIDVPNKGDSSEEGLYKSPHKASPTSGFEVPKFEEKEHRLPPLKNASHSRNFSSSYNSPWFPPVKKNNSGYVGNKPKKNSSRENTGSIDIDDLLGNDDKEYMSGGFSLNPYMVPLLVMLASVILVIN